MFFADVQLTANTVHLQAFRKAACVAEERRHGFTHSHNDTFSWCARPDNSVLVVLRYQTCTLSCISLSPSCMKLARMRTHGLRMRHSPVPKGQDCGERRCSACAGTSFTSTSATAHDERHIGRHACTRMLLFVRRRRGSRACVFYRVGSVCRTQAAVPHAE